MFDKLRRARADLATMHVLLPAAERMARAEGIDEPGAEHLLLAALDLDDGIARRALGRFHLEPADVRAGIVGHHEEALRAVGVIADDNAITAALPDGGRARGLYRAQASARQAFQQAVALAGRERAAVTSGHLLLAVTEPEHGTVARVLEHLGVDRDQLREHTRRLLAG